MLSENIKASRGAKGLSQEELAVTLNVVRQTVSKWERGLSVPDADMLIALSEVLEVPVSTLLGQAASASKADGVRVLAEKLEAINLQLAHQRDVRRKALRAALAVVCAITVVAFACLAMMGSPYLVWDFSDPETAVAGTLFHAFEWIFVRAAPFVLVGAVAGMCLTRGRAT